MIILYYHIPLEHIGRAISMSDIQIINVSVELFCGLLSLIFLVCASIGGSKGRINQLYSWMLGTNGILLLSDAVAWAVKGSPGMGVYVAVRISNFFGFAMGYVLLGLCGEYMITLVGEKTEIPRYYRTIVWGIALLAVVSVVISQFTDLYYTVDENNLYQRETYFWVSQVWGITAMLMFLLVFMRYRKHLPPREAVPLACYIILPACAMVAQLFLYGIALLNIVTTICIMILYIGIQNDQSRRIWVQEQLITESRIAVMLSQIQPHFLFNALSVVENLCVEDPPQAQEAVHEFASYLRHNLDSLSHNGLIPFEEELRHVRNYISLEQRRFGDDLEIRYDVGVSGFQVPPLSVQPIVENAVRYGGGAMALSTMEDKDEWRIIVADDGPGFDVRAERKDNKSHIGIRSVRARLEAMCGGRLEIDSRPGEGTVITIRIPKDGGIA